MHTHPWACRGTFPHSGDSQAQTLIRKQVQLTQSDSHMGSVTHTTTPVNPAAATHCTNTHEMLLLAFTLFSPTHGFMSGHSPVDLWPKQASKHTQGLTIRLMECTHKDPPMHTHIYLNEGFGLGNSLSRNKNKCQKEKKPQKTRAWGTAQTKASTDLHTHTHTVAAVSQAGLSSQLQLSACWVCFS